MVFYFHLWNKYQSMLDCYFPEAYVLSKNDIKKILGVSINPVCYKPTYDIIDLDISLNQEAQKIINNQKNPKSFIIFDYAIYFPDRDNMPGATIKQYFEGMDCQEFIDKHQHEKCIVEFRILYYDSHELNEFMNLFKADIAYPVLKNYVQNWLDVVIPEYQSSIFGLSFREIKSPAINNYHTALFNLKRKINMNKPTLARRLFGTTKHSKKHQKPKKNINDNEESRKISQNKSAKSCEDYIYLFQNLNA